MSERRGRALITGASAGIGAAYARALARAGSDLVIVARRRDRLEALAAELRGDTGVEVDVLVADLAADDGVRAVEDALGADERLTLLVNNAGFGAYRPFADVEPATAEALVRVHVLATVRLTRAALPGMVARGGGGVINVASMLAFSGTAGVGRLPHRAVYAGGKAFMVTFTQTLADELAGTGVRVQVCCPGLVRTEFHEVQGIDMSALPRMESDELVRASLAGLDQDEVVCVPTLEDRTRLDEVFETQRELLFSSNRIEAAARYQV